MTEQTTWVMEQTATGSKTKQVVFIGVLTLFTITAAALLHTNEPEFILDRFAGLTELEYTYFDSILYVSYLIAGILTGILSDRIAKRRIFIAVGSAGSAVFYWLMTTTLVYPVLLAFRFGQGWFTVMVWQSLMTLILDHSGSGERGKHMGIYGVFLALAMGMGPMLGGFIAAVDVFMPYYAATALSLMVLLLALIGVHDPEIIKTRPSLAQSLSITKNNPKLVVPGIFNFIDRLHMGFILTALPLFLLQVLGLSESLRGMALGLFAVPFIVLQYPMGRLSDKYGRYRQLILGSLAYGVIMMMLGYVGSFGFSSLLVILLLLGLFSGVTAPPSMALVGDYVKREDSAMAMGFFNFLGNLGLIMGPVVLGVLLLYADFVTAFVVAGLLELISLAVNVAIIKGKFKEPIR
jgi:MFS family permease